MKFFFLYILNARTRAFLFTLSLPSSFSVYNICSIVTPAGIGCTDDEKEGSLKFESKRQTDNGKPKVRRKKKSERLNISPDSMLALTQTYFHSIRKGRQWELPQQQQQPSLVCCSARVFVVYACSHNGNINSQLLQHKHLLSRSLTSYRLRTNAVVFLFSSCSCASLSVNFGKLRKTNF